MTNLNYEIKERKKYQFNSENDEIENNHQESSNYLNSKNDEIKNKSSYQYQAKLLLLSLLLLSSLLIIIFEVNKQKNLDNEFTYTTTCSFVNELSDLEQVLSYRVSYRRVANMVEKSPAFKSHSTQISEGLRGFCDKLLNASLNIIKMYQEGIQLFKFYDEEFKLIKDRFFLDSSYREGDVRYFFEKINNILIKFQHFNQLVKQTNSFIDSLEYNRHMIESYVNIGLRDAQKFIIKNDNGYPSDSTVESTIAREEIKHIKNVLIDLYNTAIYLDKLKKILMVYEESLLDASLTFRNTVEDGILEMSAQDIKYLEYSVEYLKSIHYQFIRE